jgi:hypothetical protein
MWVSRGSTSALGFVAFDYRWSSPVLATPPSGRISSNNVDPLLATIVYINRVDNSGIDREIFFENLQTGDWLNVALRTDANNRYAYDIVGAPVLTLDVWAIPVTVFEVIGVPLSNNIQVALILRYTGVTSHVDLTNILPDDHHPQAHEHDGLDGSGLVDYNDLVNIPAAGSELTLTDVKVAAYLAVTGDLIPASTLAASITITLPLTPAIGDKVGWQDYDNNFAVNNLIMARNGSLIEGLAEDLNVNINNSNIALIYVDAVKGWKFT